MRECAKLCKAYNKSCLAKSCKYWIEFGEDQNCTLIAIDKNGAMTLREVANRLGISFVRVKQIQDKAMRKVVKSLNKDKAY